VKLIKRSQWGAKHGRGPTNITPEKGGVAIHYVGGGKLTGIEHSRCAARVRQIEEDHVNGNGWAGIAYNFLACEHGYVFEGRGLGRRSAAQGTTSGNQNYYAVCALIGDKDPSDDPLKNALRDAIDYLRDHRAGSRIKGHRDFRATSCPGERLYSWVREGAPRPGSPSVPTWPGRYLRLTNPYLRGADVGWVQQRLNSTGARPSLNVDDIYGPLTRAAVIAYQEVSGLDPDGIVGPRTWEALAA
jgi:hypothetical protein